MSTERRPGRTPSSKADGHEAGLEVLSAEECERLLRSRGLGRLSLVVDGQPEIFPVNFAFEGGAVVFRTASGTKLERGPLSVAAFEVDDVDPRTGVAWSVVVKGTLHEIGQAIDPLSERLRESDVEPMAPGERHEWMALHAERISGRRFTLPGARSGREHDRGSR